MKNLTVFGLIILLSISLSNEGFSQDLKPSKKLDQNRGFEFTFHTGLSEDMTFGAAPGSYNRLSSRYAFLRRRIGISLGVGTGFQSFGIKKDSEQLDMLGLSTNAYNATINIVPVSVDLLISYTHRFGPRGNVTFEIGPQLNVITSGKLNIDQVFTNVDIEHNLPLRQSLNAGLTTGINHRIPLAPWMWLSFKYGFQYIFGKPSLEEGETSNFLTYQNNTIPGSDEYYISGGVVNQQGIEFALLKAPEKIGGQHHFSIGLIWTLPSVEK
ncbi:MAG: hypothetical protein ACPGU4_00365 [Flavobacteriales bacterium]